MATSMSEYNPEPQGTSHNDIPTWGILALWKINGVTMYSIEARFFTEDEARGACLKRQSAADLILAGVREVSVQYRIVLIPRVSLFT